MSQIEVDKVIPQSGTNLQIGEAGDTINLTNATVNLPVGAAGTAWQAVKTSSFTAVAGEGYFVNTTEIEHALESGQIKVHSRIVSRFETIDENGNKKFEKHISTAGRFLLSNLIPKNFNNKFYRPFSTCSFLLELLSLYVSINKKVKILDFGANNLDNFIYLNLILFNFKKLNNLY